MSSDSISSQLYPLSTDARPWHMSHAERCALLQVLRIAQPRNALEIGTGDGGCLQHIRAHARRTFSIDIDPGVKSRLAPDMPEVEFLTGNSSTLVVEVLRRCTAQGEPVHFVLVDGDHTYAGVKADLDALLTYHPTEPLWILLHDSANPECRRGILAASWSANPHVHLLDVDFVAGTVNESEDFAGQLWGGLGLAVLRPESRSGPLPALSSGTATFEALYRGSLNYPSTTNRLRRWWRLKSMGLRRRLDGLRSH